MQPRAIYNILELAIYTPATLASLSVARRHQDATKSAWTGLILLGITRIVAAATSLADIFDASRSLRVAATAMHPVSLAALLYTPMILMTRVNATMWQQRAPQRYFWLTIFPLIIAFVVGLTGALNTTSSDQLDHHKGWVRLRVSGAFFLVEVILLMAVAGFNMLRYSHVPKNEVRLLYSVAIGITASLLPALFALIAAAIEQSRYYWTPNADLGLILSAIFITAPEALAFVVYLWAGFTVQLLTTKPVDDAEELPPAYDEPPPEIVERSDESQSPAVSAAGRLERAKLSKK